MMIMRRGYPSEKILKFVGISVVVLLILSGAAPGAETSPLAAPDWQEGYPSQKAGVVTLRWKPVHGAQFYRVYRDRARVGLVNGSEQPSLTLASSGRADAQFEVAAVDSEGREGPLSRRATPAAIGPVVLSPQTAKADVGIKGSGGVKTLVVALSGEYAGIDARLARQTVETLTNGTPDQRRKAIEDIKRSPENYAPPVLYVLSNVLFMAGEKETGAFWFYAGQVRARFDANRCTDVSARQAVSVLNMAFGALINQYMFQDLSKLKEIVPKAVDWDKETPHNYDHRWINLHGLSAMNSALGGKNTSEPVQLSLPREQWEKIADQTRKDYLEGFATLVAQLERKKK